MHNQHRAIGFAVLLLVALFSFSCTQDVEGIFYSLEKEIKVPDNSLNNDISVVGIVKATFGGTPYYLAAAGSVFYRTVGETEWHKLKNPIGESVVTDIETASGKVLASFSSGGSHGIFPLDTTTAPPAYTNTNLYSAKQVFRLFQANGHIFASIGMTEAEAEMVYFPLGVAPATPTNFPTTRWVRGLTWDTTNYVLCTSTDVYSATTPTGVWGQAVFSAPGFSFLRDVFWDGTNIYLSARNYLSKWTGAAWSTVNPGTDFTNWAKVNGKLLVGTDGSGYREVDAGLNVSTPPGNFLRIPGLLYATVISAFTDANTIFFGTSVNGLWKGDYTTTTDPSWSQE